MKFRLCLMKSKAAAIRLSASMMNCTALAEKSRAGYTADVKALIAKYGADKLSDVDPANYAALLKDAEVIGNA